jgi:hypothetical protein
MANSLQFYSLFHLLVCYNEKYISSATLSRASINRTKALITTHKLADLGTLEYLLPQPTKVSATMIVFFNLGTFPRLLHTIM